MTKTLFTIPALLTFVPAGINHLCGVCPWAVRCTRILCITLLCSGNVLCIHGLSSRWKARLHLAQCYRSSHAGASLFREVCLDAFCSCIYCSFKNKIKEFQQNVVEYLTNIFFLLECVFYHPVTLLHIQLKENL